MISERGVSIPHIYFTHIYTYIPLHLTSCDIRTVNVKKLIRLWIQLVVSAVTVMLAHVVLDADYAHEIVRIKMTLWSESTLMLKRRARFDLPMASFLT